MPYLAVFAKSDFQVPPKLKLDCVKLALDSVSGLRTPHAAELRRVFQSWSLGAHTTRSSPAQGDALYSQTSLESVFLVNVRET